MSIVVFLALGFISYCFFDHAATFRGLWPIRGQPNTSPRETFTVAVVTLAFAIFFLYCGLHHHALHH
ncbi:MAG: hypothetical protein RLY20_2104 [Verrucomicrobiota bacterium]